MVPVRQNVSLAGWSRYIADVTKRLVDIDDEVLDQAREVLGTATIKATVNQALADAVALAARRRHLRRLESNGLPDLLDPEVQASAWR